MPAPQTQAKDLDFSRNEKHSVGIPKYMTGWGGTGGGGRAKRMD